MKPFTGSLIALLFSLTGFAQDWAPYVPGQVSLYQSIDRPYSYAMPHDTAIALRALDTMFIRNGYTVYYFKSHSHSNKLGTSSYCNHIDKPDSLVYRDGYYTYYRNDQAISGFGGSTDSVNYYFDGSVGTQWYVPWIDFAGHPDSIKIKVGDVRVDTFLGLVDSVKEFDVFIPFQDTGKLIISKSYGFIKGFLPLPGFFVWVWNTHVDALSSVPDHTLIGLINDSIQIGDTIIPQPEAFFPYTPGTILKWDHSRGDYFSGSSIYTDSRDSITDIIFTDSSVEVKSVTTHNYSGPVDTISGTRNFPLYPFKLQLSAHSNYYVAEPKNGFEEVKTRSIGYYHSQGRPFFSLSFEWLGGLWSGKVENCKVEPGFAYEDFEGKWDLFNTQYGNYFYGEDDERTGWYSNSTLIGYYSPTDSFGDISQVEPRPIGMQDLLVSTFKITPNPASFQVALNLPTQTLQGALLTVCDLAGRIVAQEFLHGREVLSVEHLQPGLYFITVTTESERYQSKLVVE